MRLLERIFPIGMASVLLVKGTSELLAATVYEDYVFTTVAGPPEAGSGWFDGLGEQARFSYPGELAIDGQDNLYVADINNFTIRKVFSDGRVTTLAGLAGVAGSNDGSASTARFFSPQGVAVDPAGNVFVTDTYNHTIRRISASGMVTTYAGKAGTAGSTDGLATLARFKNPVGLALDTTGTLFVADTGNYTIRKITADGQVSTLAGKAGAPGTANGTGSLARFNNPFGITLDSAGNIFVGDSANHAIRKVTPLGLVTTFAGKAGASGSNDGTNSAARFYNPCQLAFDPAGNLYVVEAGNNTLRKISAEGVVTTLAGTAPYTGSADGTNGTARFYNPVGLAIDSRTNLYVGDTYNHTLRRIAPDGAVTTIAGLAATRGTNDGPSFSARFNVPFGLCLDVATNLYVADAYNHAIRKITKDGVVTTWAGVSGNPGTNDGSSLSATFNYPFDVVVDPAGNAYVADTYNFTIRKIAIDGTVSTLAGSPGRSGSTDGAGSVARFYYPFGLALDNATNLYVADTFNNTIRKVTPTGMVTTLAGTAGLSGTADGTGSLARFNNPYGIVADSAGTLFVADTGNHTIRKITGAGKVSTVAGKAGISGNADGVASVSRFKNPRRLAVDPQGNVFVADGDNHIMRKITSGGNVTTLAGSPGVPGTTDGAGNVARFYNPEGVAISPGGLLFVADAGNHVIRQGSPLLPDIAMVDKSLGNIGELRQLDISNRTTTAWAWSIGRYPARAAAQLSETNSFQTTLTPDVSDLFIVRFKGTDAFGRVALNTVAVGVDTTSPGIAIVSPLSGQRWSNAVFTATGTATDNVAVASIWCQVNQGQPLLAAGTTMWSAPLELTPGTNLISAYALDLNGNYSPTTSVALVYVQSAFLSLGTNGNGTITPNYDGQLLEIGKNYSLKATAAANFTFVNWTGSIPTNAANLVFQMQSNLTFVANFRDSLIPTVTITAPKANQKWSNAVITVTGTAKDNTFVEQVWCGLNASNWFPASGSTNWFTTLTLVPGTNSISAYAIDGAGNPSKTNSVKVFYDVAHSPPSIVQSPLNQSVKPGSTVSFAVVATGANPLAYHWYHDGNALSDTLHITGSGSNIVTITSVESSDAGNYTVVVSNGLGSTSNAPPAVLSVNQVAPSFVAGSLARDSDGTFHFTLQSEPGSNLEVQFSSDLVGWATFMTLTSTNAYTPIVDRTPGIHSRFYRAMLQP